MPLEEISTYSLFGISTLICFRTNIYILLYCIKKVPKNWSFLIVNWRSIALKVFRNIGKNGKMSGKRVKCKAKHFVTPWSRASNYCSNFLPWKRCCVKAKNYPAALLNFCLQGAWVFFSQNGLSWGQKILGQLFSSCKKEEDVSHVWAWIKDQ